MMRKTFRRGPVALAACSVWLAFGTSPVAAEPRVNELIAYYDVSGNTAEALRETLSRIGPFDANGRQFDAMTRWYVTWRFNYSQLGESCGIAGVTTRAQVNIILPRLAHDVTLATDVRQKFEAFAAALLVHARGHGKIGIDTAWRIEEGIAQLPPEPNCDRMGQVANEFGAQLIKEANQQDLAYDAETNHGATLGARFP